MKTIGSGTELASNASENVLPDEAGSAGVCGAQQDDISWRPHPLLNDDNISDLEGGARHAHQPTLSQLHVPATIEEGRAASKSPH